MLNGGHLRPEEYVGLKVEEAVPNIWPEVEPMLLGVLETGKTWTGEIPTVMFDGTSRVYEVEYRPLLAANWPEMWHNNQPPPGALGIDASVWIKGQDVSPTPAHGLKDALVEFAVARVHRQWLRYGDTR